MLFIYLCIVMRKVFRVRCCISLWLVVCKLIYFSSNLRSTTMIPYSVGPYLIETLILHEDCLYFGMLTHRTYSMLSHILQLHQLQNIHVLCCPHFCAITNLFTLLTV